MKIYAAITLVQFKYWSDYRFRTRFAQQQIHPTTRHIWFQMLKTEQRCLL